MNTANIFNSTARHWAKAFSLKLLTPRIQRLRGRKRHLPDCSPEKASEAGRDAERLTLVHDPAVATFSSLLVLDQRRKMKPNGSTISASPIASSSNMPLPILGQWRSSCVGGSRPLALWRSCQSDYPRLAGQNSACFCGSRSRRSGKIWLNRRDSRHQRAR